MPDPPDNVLTNAARAIGSALGSLAAKAKTIHLPKKQASTPSAPKSKPVAAKPRKPSSKPGKRARPRSSGSQ